jgi:hypothetical protein
MAIRIDPGWLANFFGLSPLPTFLGVKGIVRGLHNWGISEIYESHGLNAPSDFRLVLLPRISIGSMAEQASADVIKMLHARALV